MRFYKVRVIINRREKRVKLIPRVNLFHASGTYVSTQRCATCTSVQWPQIVSRAPSIGLSLAVKPCRKCTPENYTAQG